MVHSIVEHKGVSVVAISPQIEGRIESHLRE